MSSGQEIFEPPAASSREGARERPREAQREKTADPLRPLPWQGDLWRRADEQIRAGNLPHALLLRGGRGAGKEHFARALAARLLCLSPADAYACGECAGCKLLRFGSHPDLRILQPEREGGPISILQVRSLLENFSTAAQRGGWRIAILRPAEAMNMHAANALLKSLEEPGAGTLFMLPAHCPERLPATVRSRCQSLDFPPPAAQEALPWLQAALPSGVSAQALLGAAGGLPLAALELHKNGGMQRNAERIVQWRDFCAGRSGVGELAGIWGERAQESLEWLVDWLLDARRVQAGVAASMLRHAERRAELRELGVAVDAETLHRMLGRSLQTLGRLQGGVNLEPSLALEDLLIFCAGIFTRRLQNAPTAEQAQAGQ